MPADRRALLGGSACSSRARSFVGRLLIIGFVIGFVIGFIIGFAVLHSGYKTFVSLSLVAFSLISGIF